MFRKICILLVIAISLKNVDCKETDEQGYLSKLTNLPFDAADASLAAANDALYNAIDFATSFTERLSEKFSSMTKKMLSIAQEIGEGTIETMRSVLKVLKNAKDEIGQTLKGIHFDLSAAKEQFLDKLRHMKEVILKDAINTSHEFLKNVTAAAQEQLENALTNGEKALEEASYLASEFIKEAKEKADSTKVELFEKISAEVERLREEYKTIKEEIREKLKKLAEDIKNAGDKKEIEEYQKELSEYFEHLKSVINDASKLATKAKNQIEELIEKGKQALGKLSEDLESKMENIHNKLIELAEQADTFKYNLIASAKESIDSIIERSKGYITSFFGQVGKTLKGSMTHLNNIFNATASIVGDFFNKNMPGVSAAVNGAMESIEKMHEKIADFFNSLNKVQEDFEEKEEQHEELREKRETSQSDIDFSGNTLENASNAFNELIEKIKQAAEVGRTALEELFEKSLEIFEDSKAKIEAAVSDDMEYIQKKSAQVKEYLNELTTKIGEKIKVAKEKFVAFVTETYEKIRESIKNRLDTIKEQVKNGVNGTKQLYYKISNKLEELREKASEALDDFQAKLTVKISDTIEQVQIQAKEIEEFIEKKFIQGSKKAVECIQKHKDEIPKILSDLTQQISECGSVGFNSAVENINESLELQNGLSPKLEKLVEEYKKCKKESYFFSSVSCLGKLSFENVLGITKASADITAEIATATKDVAVCSLDKAQISRDTFSKLSADIEKCLAEE